MIIAHTIAALIGNYMTTCFVIGLLVAAVQIARHHGPRTSAVIGEKLLNAFVFWAIGMGQTINFVMHSFFGSFAAKTIGWAQSPFQLELAFSSLGFGIIAFIAASKHGTLSSKAGVVLAAAVFGFGAAGGHVFQLIVNHDHAANNIGLLLYSDVVINAVGLVFLVWCAITSRARLDGSAGQPSHPRPGRGRSHSLTAGSHGRGPTGRSSRPRPLRFRIA